MKNYALITGSSDRIGKGVALDFAKRGHNILLHHKDSNSAVQKVKNEVEQLGVKAQTVEIDFLKETDYDQLFKNFHEQGIVIDTLVNCASDFQPSDFEKKGSDLLNREIKINFENAYLLTKAFARTYDTGLIINFLDTKVTKNYTKHLDYLLSKKLLKEFTKLAAVELAPNFRVNAVAPGLILPPKDKDENYLLELAKNIPLQTIGSLEEILKAVRFISESFFLTGQILYIDGGDHLI